MVSTATRAGYKWKVAQHPATHWVMCGLPVISPAYYVTEPEEALAIRSAASAIAPAVVASGSKANAIAMGAQVAKMAWDNRAYIGKAGRSVARLFTKKKGKQAATIARASSGQLALPAGSGGRRVKLTAPASAVRTRRPLSLQKAPGRNDNIVVRLRQASGMCQTNGSGVPSVAYIPLDCNINTMIAKFATLYREARLRALTIRYTPVCNDSQAGQLIGWFDFTCNDPATNTETFLAATDNAGAQSVAPWSSKTWKWKRQDNTDDEFVTIAGSTGVHANTPFHKGGDGHGHVFFVRGTGIPASQTLGFFTVEATVEFSGLTG